MSRKKPTIGVTGPVKGGLAAWWFTALAVRLHGGRPVRIHPEKSRKDIRLNGLILGGGADISPDRYGELLAERPHAQPKAKGFRARLIQLFSVLLYPFLFLLRNIISSKTAGRNTARDDLEFKLLDEACRREIPVLGICRGAQLINVKFGGSLHQDISGFYTEVPKVHTVWPRKTVSVNEASNLYKIMGTDEARVNALHYQAVDTLGEDLQIAARETTGVIQGIEHTGFDYLLGVQWHPEYMPQIPMQRALFKELVEKAANVRREM